jgi:hypothetical protein
MVWAVAERGSTRNAWLDQKFLGIGWDDENLTNGLKKSPDLMPCEFFLWG